MDDFPAHTPAWLDLRVPDGNRHFPKSGHRGGVKERGQSIGSSPDGFILMLVILPSGGEQYPRVRLLRKPVAAGSRARGWFASPIRRAARCRRALGRETALT